MNASNATLLSHQCRITIFRQFWWARFLAASFLVSLTGFSISVSAQDVVVPADADTPKTGQAYAEAMRELDTRFVQNREAGTKLVEEREATWRRIVQNQANIEQLLARQANGSQIISQFQRVTTAMQIDFMRQAPEQQVPTAPNESVNRRDGFVSPMLRAGRNEADKNAAQQTVRALTQLDVLNQQLRAVNAAGNIALQRHITMVQELSRIYEEAAAWSIKPQAVFDEYWELTDVFGIRDETELQATLNYLDNASEGNVGAMFARVVTLIRLGRIDEAEVLLKPLIETPALKVLALAVRVELLARKGESRKVLNEYRRILALGQQNVRVRIHLAQALGAAGEYRKADREWDAVLELGGYEIAARRGSALVNGSMPNPSRASIEKAKDNARLAAQLAGEEWASEVAVALAHVANDETDQAVEAAERAASFTIENNREFCEELAKQIQIGNAVSWRF